MSSKQIKKQVKLLSDSERNSRTWLEHSPVCTKIVDLDFNLQYMSRTGIEVLCIDDITVYYGKPYPLHIYSQPYRDNWKASFNQVKETGVMAKLEVMAISMENSEIWFDSTFIPVMSDSGCLEYIIIVSIDITKRKQAENNLRQLNTELEERVAQRTIELEDANNQLKNLNAKLRVLSETDALTKIANRRAYERRITENIYTAKRTVQPLSLLMLDIDNFKKYNDEYGHHLGDVTLRKVANSITKSLLRKTDLVARFGGEEFVVLLPDTDSKSALFVAETIRTNIESLKIMFQGNAISKNVTVSIGIASLQGDELDKVELLKRADIALYLVKDNGRNNSLLFDE